LPSSPVIAFFLFHNFTISLSYVYTANVCRDLRGVYREIRVQGFQICRVCMLPTIPAIFLKEKQ
jgi:hypothetical protein